MTILVFLAGAAGTGIVAADLLLHMDGGIALGLSAVGHHIRPRSAHTAHVRAAALGLPYILRCILPYGNGCPQQELDDLTAEALDTRREWFIQEVIDHYDMVEIGTLYFGDMAIDVESIYYDKTEHRLMVHISSKEMEGDITYTSLEREKQGKLVELVFEEMKCLEEGPTLLGMMIDGNNILYRNVFIKELNAEVKVTTEEVFEAHIEEGSPDDDKFYCYVPAEEFFKLNDIDFEKYVNKNF